MNAGQSYYVKGLMKEGGGGDNFAVTWVKKGADAPAPDSLPIPRSDLTPASTIDYTYTGFVLDDKASDLTKSPSGTVDVTEKSIVGEYNITIGGAESPNYEITHTDGKVTVGPATLTVTGDNKEVFETEALPTLTYTYSGFLNGDTAATNIVTTASSVTTAADNMTPGDYPIVTSGGVAVNYTIKNVDGVLKVKTVTKPKVTGLTVSTSNPLEGDNVTYTVTATGDIIVYKWYKGSELVQTGGTTYTLNDVSVSDSARIQVFAENFKGKSRKLSSLKIKERLNQVFLVVGANSKPVQGANSIKIREYHDIGGSEISGLTSSSKYPDSPDAVKSASSFESEISDMSYVASKSTMSLKSIVPSLIASFQLIIDLIVIGLSHIAPIIFSLPASILFAIAISPSLESNSTPPISLRYILIGSSLLSAVFSSAAEVFSFFLFD